jgi:tetratricopeptide (TPR) repeat protein
MSPLFRGRGREEAEAALRSCDDALTVLEPSRADLGPARRLRDRAQEAFRAKDAKAAVVAARKAEATAKLLDRLHRMASRGIARLRKERSRMAKLGMDPRDIDPLIEEASSWMRRSVERDGDPDFPAYGRAAELALKGLKLAQFRIPRYKAAAGTVADAEQAIRAAVGSNRFVAPDAFRFFVLRPATDALEAAYVRLRANEFKEAAGLARSALKKTEGIHETYVRVTAAYETATEAARALKEEGATVIEVEDLLAVCRSALERGKFADAAEVSAQAARRLGEIRDVYRDLVLRRKTAEETIAEVEQWGFDVREPRGILRSAKSLMESGRYEEAAGLLEEARTAAQGLRDTRRTNAARIAEMRRSIPGLRAVNADVAADAEALLGKAEAFLDEGRSRECEEKLQIASLLLVGPGGSEGASNGRRGPVDISAASPPTGPACPTCGGPLAEDGTCPACAGPMESENSTAKEIDIVQQAVDDAREIIEELEREQERPASEKVRTQVRGCAMCGRPLDGEDVLCARCQSVMDGRGA